MTPLLPEALRKTCEQHLAAFSHTSSNDPLAANVRHLAIFLIERLETGKASVADLLALAKAIGDDALRARADRLRAAVAGPAWAELVATLLEPLKSASLAVVRQALEPARMGIVFTGHPTFALSTAMRSALGQLASNPAADVDLSDLAHAPDPTISLAAEHHAASAAIELAQEALRELASAVYDWLIRHFPLNWWQIAPAPIRLATWVSYDLDGRTDIHWAETLRIRLTEKACQLRRYATRLDEMAGDRTVDGEIGQLAVLLRAAAETADTQGARFQGDLADPDQVVAAANALTHGQDTPLVSLSAIVTQIAALIEAEPDTGRRKSLSMLRAEMIAYGLGVAGVHVRVNASQVRSAVQADLGLSNTGEFFDRRAMASAADRATAARQQPVNFGTVFQEKKTARRQMMLCAQILKHIDADAPIRFLIAEIESPATIMGAIYLARLYGIAHKLDVSPLFETPDALERGGRFLERLLDEPEYLAYVRGRGRLCIQLGFSDSGRFMGQIAADLAIERVHVLLSRAMAVRDVRDVEVVIFNTHGESMGRGGYPGTLDERFDHLLTPWARARFAHDRIRVNAEVSFQGGDGFVHFETPALAAATVRGAFAWAFKPVEKLPDAFYDDINFSWDVYRGIKSWQEAMFADAHYQAVLGSFGPNLLPSTGSRKSRRQSGASKGDVARSLRAIPHNGILQQLAAPANVTGGLGFVAAREPERFQARVRASRRLSRLVQMAHAARRLMSLSTLRTYADLYSPSFWTVRAARTSDDGASELALRIADRLDRQGLDISISRLANRLSADRRRLDAVAEDLFPATVGDAAFPTDLYILHAVRFACMVEGFKLAGSVPAFSPRHDLTRDDLIDMALDLRFADVARALDEIFPAEDTAPIQFTRLAEPAAAPETHGGYAHIGQQISAPLVELDRAIKSLSVSISHAYGAIG